MKKLILGIIIGGSLTTLIAAGVENYVVNRNTAEVETYQNVRIFTDSKPIKEYEYLGIVKAHIGLTGHYSEIRGILIKNAIKKYPNAEGLIIKDDVADVIKFK